MVELLIREKREKSFEPSDGTDGDAAADEFTVVFASTARIPGASDVTIDVVRTSIGEGNKWTNLQLVQECPSAWRGTCDPWQSEWMNLEE